MTSEKVGGDVAVMPRYAVVVAHSKAHLPRAIRAFVVPKRQTARGNVQAQHVTVRKRDERRIPEAPGVVRGDKDARGIPRCTAVVTAT